MQNSRFEIGEFRESSYWKTTAWWDMLSDWQKEKIAKAAREFEQNMAELMLAEEARRLAGLGVVPKVIAKRLVLPLEVVERFLSE